MTLVLNEIYFEDGMKNPVIVSSADQMLTSIISGEDTKKKLFVERSQAQKLFRLNEVQGTVSYFGLARWNGNRTMQDLVTRLIIECDKTSNLGCFVKAFYQGISAKTYYIKALLQQQASGFQICGFNDQGLPEHWLICNYDSVDKGGAPAGFKSTYNAPREDFLGRDAVSVGYFADDTRFVKAGFARYMNGNIELQVNFMKSAKSRQPYVADKLLDLAQRDYYFQSKIQRYYQTTSEALIGLHTEAPQYANIGPSPEIIVLRLNDPNPHEKLRLSEDVRSSFGLENSAVCPMVTAVCVPVRAETFFINVNPNAVKSKE